MPNATPVRHVAAAATAVAWDRAGFGSAQPFFHIEAQASGWSGLPLDPVPMPPPARPGNLLSRWLALQPAPMRQAVA